MTPVLFALTFAFAISVQVNAFVDWLFDVTPPE